MLKKTGHELAAAAHGAHGSERRYRVGLASLHIDAAACWRDGSSVKRVAAERGRQSAELATGICFAGLRDSPELTTPRDAGETCAGLGTDPQPSPLSSMPPSCSAR